MFSSLKLHPLGRSLKPRFNVELGGFSCSSIFRNVFSSSKAINFKHSSILSKSIQIKSRWRPITTTPVDRQKRFFQANERKLSNYISRLYQHDKVVFPTEHLYNDLLCTMFLMYRLTREGLLLPNGTSYEGFGKNAENLYRKITRKNSSGWIPSMDCLLSYAEYSISEDFQYFQRVNKAASSEPFMNKVVYIITRRSNSPHRVNYGPTWLHTHIDSNASMARLKSLQTLDSLIRYRYDYFYEPIKNSEGYNSKVDSMLDEVKKLEDKFLFTNPEIRFVNRMSKWLVSNGGISYFSFRDDQITDGGRKIPFLYEDGIIVDRAIDKVQNWLGL